MASKCWSGLCPVGLMAPTPAVCAGGWMGRRRRGGARYSNIDLLWRDSMLSKSAGSGSTQKKSWFRAASAVRRLVGSRVRRESRRSRAYWSWEKTEDRGELILYWTCGGLAKKIKWNKLNLTWNELWKKSCEIGLHFLKNVYRSNKSQLKLKCMGYWQ